MNPDLNITIPPLTQNSMKKIEQSPWTGLYWSCLPCDGCSIFSQQCATEVGGGVGLLLLVVELMQVKGVFFGEGVCLYVLS